ncbi:hypothetical protein HDU76_001618, partial [Blyttiomyces sp. JEL0837]
MKLEDELREIKRELKNAQESEDLLKAAIKAKGDFKHELESMISKQGARIKELESMKKDYEFTIDELRVAVVKNERKSEDLEKNLLQVAQKNEFLAHMESTFREENGALQKRLRELIDANKEVTSNYQAIKKNHDLKRSEFEELATELEEAKNACQLSIRQKKGLQNDLNVVMKQRQELMDKNKAMENLLARKEKDIADLLTKVNDTINDYELKLERKEEQMWAMSLQMSEESQKNRNHINIDPDFINDIEKKWQALNATVADLQKKQFQPRMERLKAIEKDIKSRMEEYALAEERMETGFLCPRDLQCFHKPMTLIPCGHTYCKGCLDQLKEENYNVIKCQVCNVPVEHVFRNEQLESVEEQFLRRKTLTLSFLEWIKMLKVYLPETYWFVATLSTKGFDIKTRQMYSIASAASQEAQLSAPNLADKAWELVQRKTFTNWINNQLKKQKISPIQELDADLSSGEKLIQLLEVISDSSLGKYNKNPKLRIQKVENCNKVLEFTKKRGVPLTNIGAEDIVDANGKLICGLIWSIILRFAISEIKEEGLSAKEGLLLWCQRKTTPYAADFHIKDFTTSWTDGLALCGLIHRHRPDLIDYWSLNNQARHDNTRLAKDVAEQYLGIPKLMDVEDLCDMVKPEERSVITYVSQFYHAFSALEKFGVAGRRVGQFGSILEQTWAMVHDYEERARALKTNVGGMIESWNQPLPTDYHAARSLLANFDTYKNTTKRQWIVEKRELESLLGNILTKLRTYNLRPYSPPAGLSPSDLAATWERLLQVEAARKRSLSNAVREAREALRLAFANAANKLSNDLHQISLALAKVDGPLEQQLSDVQTLIDKLEPLKNVLGSLVKKVSFIENQMVARGMTNVTPERLEEWTETFKIFDKENRNSLNRDQFIGALEALGIYNESEFDKTFPTISSGGQVAFQQYMEHVKSHVEDRTTMDACLSAFKSLALDKDTIKTEEMLRGGVPASVIEYFTREMKSANGELDYRSFVT